MRDTVTPSHASPRLFHAAVALGIVVLAGATGSLVTRPQIVGWYALLAKPSFTPPNWAFGPAWTTLYLMMAYAFYRVLGLDRQEPGRTTAIGVFVIHMILNSLWSISFFGMRSPPLGVAELCLFWPAAILNAVLFARLDRTSGALMVPNILWVSFAAALNIAIWRMN